ncbi:MAG: phage head-tail adapter protein, partial [Helicobacter sp.]|nr:phage head-tail adapter protein [Helicobacter sp.]
MKESLRKRNKSHIFIPILPAKTRRILASFQESYFSNSDIVKLEQVLEYPEVSEVIALLQIAFNHYT